MPALNGRFSTKPYLAELQFQLRNPVFFDLLPMSRRTTLTQFLVEQQRAANAIKPELRLLVKVDGPS
jgi:hypothetical protein